jgi:hypothetical protein
MNNPVTPSTPIRINAKIPIIIATPPYSLELHQALLSLDVPSFAICAASMYFLARFAERHDVKIYRFAGEGQSLLTTSELGIWIRSCGLACHKITLVLQEGNADHPEDPLTD